MDTEITQLRNEVQELKNELEKMKTEIIELRKGTVQGFMCRPWYPEGQRPNVPYLDKMKNLSGINSIH
jgi:hypothetical protein